MVEGAEEAVVLEVLLLDSVFEDDLGSGYGKKTVRNLSLIKLLSNLLTTFQINHSSRSNFVPHDSHDWLASSYIITS